MNKVFKHFVIFLSLIITIGCAVIPFHSKHDGIRSVKNTKVIVRVNPVIKDEDGKEILSVDESVSKYANDIFQKCNSDCEKQTDIQINFIARSNSETRLFKIWKWVGILSLGIIPVDEVTKITLLADIKTPTSDKQIKKEINRHLVFSIVLFPFNIFRDWQDDYFGAQKILIDQLADELALM